MLRLVGTASIQTTCRFPSSTNSLKWRNAKGDKMTTIDRTIESKVGDVRTDAFDLSFGEIISLYKAMPREFEISPDFQRYFRWTTDQQSRLIESALLELPIPQIFVIERADGVIEPSMGSSESVLSYISLSQSCFRSRTTRRSFSPDGTS